MLPSDRPDPAALLASLACVMTRYVETGYQRLASLVEHQLRALQAMTAGDPLLGPASG